MGQPFTLRHGSWSPDLQNIPQEVPYQSYAAIEVPSADVEGVYYQDGAFQNLPSPNPYAYPLGVILSTTLTADSSGSNVGFGPFYGALAVTQDAEGNTLNTLSYNSGTLTLIITGKTLTSGYISALTLALAGGTPVTYTASSASFTSANSVNTWTWTGATALVSGLAYGVLLNTSSSAQILNALSWYDTVQGEALLFASTADSLYTLIDGVWGVIQPLTSVTVTGTGVSARFTIGGNVQGSGLKGAFTLGTGTVHAQLLSSTLIPSNNGTDYGYISGSMGSLTPSKDVNGHVISQLSNGAFNDRTGTFLYTLKMTTANLGASYFSSLIVGAATYPSGTMTYTTGAGFSQWTWHAGSALTASSYRVVLNP